MKRTSMSNDPCPVARSLDVIGDWWSLLIVRNALMGTRRFSEFQKQLSMAKNILAARLRTLTAHGILELGPASDGSAYKVYVLTAKGRALFPVLVALRQWSEEFSYAPGEQHSLLLDTKTGRPLQKIEIRAADGRVLQPGDTTVAMPD
ncbi:MAG TPA: helix-turn-helix domain-containing protein [Afipia sp.]